MAIEPRVCVSVRVAMDPLSMEPRVSVSMSMEPLDRSPPRHREVVENRHDLPPAVLVIGSPGTGKSVLAKHLEATSNGKAVFVSVGEILRERGLLSNFDGGDLKATAVEIVRNAACEALASGQVLLLECVKDIEDAFSLMEILQTTGMQLSQVLLIPRHGIVPPVLLPELDKPGAVQKESIRRNAERNPFDRQPKWNANASRLIDFFSSLGVLHEVLPTPLIRVLKCSPSVLPRRAPPSAGRGRGRSEGLREMLRLEATVASKDETNNVAFVAALREKREFSCEELQRLGVKINIGNDERGNRVCRACDNVDGKSYNSYQYINVSKQVFRFEIDCAKIRIPGGVYGYRGGYYGDLLGAAGYGDLLRAATGGRGDRWGGGDRGDLDGGGRGDRWGGGDREGGDANRYRPSHFRGLAEAGYGTVKENAMLDNVLPPPDGLIFAPLEAVVSERLVSNRSVRDRVLEYAAESTGLESLIKGASPLPVPSSLLGRSRV